MSNDDLHTLLEEAHANFDEAMRKRERTEAIAIEAIEDERKMATLATALFITNALTLIGLLAAVVALIL